MSGTATHPAGVTPGPRGEEYAFLRLRREGAVVHLVLDRPPLNVLNLAMLQELDAALEEIAGAAGVKLMILSGEGRGFCAGADVGDHLPGRVDRMLPLFRRVTERLLGLEFPTLAVVKSQVLGGGCELMLCCDMVLAADDALIGQPEIRLGVFPPVAAALLPRLVGRQRALEMVLTGRALTAAEAAAWGLVCKVVPRDELDGAVEEMTRRLEALSAPVLRLTKRAVLEAGERPPREGMRHAEELYLRELMLLEDASEGLEAFLEKRTPCWKEA
jgi:cyclohexa-1,5-dienecarbonyl-CoA hydratase